MADYVTSIVYIWLRSERSPVAQKWLQHVKNLVYYMVIIERRQEMRGGDAAEALAELPGSHAAKTAPRPPPQLVRRLRAQPLTWFLPPF